MIFKPDISKMIVLTGFIDEQEGYLRFSILLVDKVPIKSLTTPCIHM